MSTVPILYTSHDGHTRKIVDYMAGIMESNGLNTQVIDLEEAASPDPETLLREAPIIVIASAIRYGKPLPVAESFIRKNINTINSHPLALFSVNLTARKVGKTTPEGSVYLRKWIKRHGLAPKVAASIAGKIDYSRYGFFDKFMIRFIMMITKGPTNPSACIEFTDWKQVDDLTTQIIKIAKPK